MESNLNKNQKELIETETLRFSLKIELKRERESFKETFLNLEKNREEVLKDNLRLYEM